MIVPHPRVILDTGPVTHTKQSFRDDCDINLIVKRHASTGLWDHLNPTTPTYGDFSAAVELQSAMALVEAAHDAFDALPSAVRKVCDNNPVVMLENLAKPGAFHELVQAGMPTTPEHEELALQGGENPPALEGENTPTPAGTDSST